MRVTTNNIPRPLIDAIQLTDKERKQFDYLDWSKIDDGRDSAWFFRYRGQLYSLDQFMRTESNGDLANAGWQGYHADSMSTGTVVRYCDDTDYVIVGYYVSH